MKKQFKDLVAKYFMQGLEGEELAEFEKSLGDPACYKYFKEEEILEKMLEEGFKELSTAGDLQVKPGYIPSELDKIVEEDIKRFHREDISWETREEFWKIIHKAKLRKTIIWLVSIPAMAAAVLGFAYFLGTQHKPTPGDLYKCFYKPYATIRVQGGGEERVFTIKVNKAYESKEYKISAEICREVLAKDPTDRKTRFMYGLCLMELDSVQQAIGQFRLSEEGEGNKGDLQWVYSKWYTVLSYLELGKTDDAYAELEELRGSGSLFAGVVDKERLFRDLRRFRER